jgi:hypothetical protein
LSGVARWGSQNRKNRNGPGHDPDRPFLPAEEADIQHGIERAIEYAIEYVASGSMDSGACNRA